MFSLPASEFNRRLKSNLGYEDMQATSLGSTVSLEIYPTHRSLRLNFIDQPFISKFDLPLTSNYVSSQNNSTILISAHLVGLMFVN
jgi:hypothetical protein